MPELHHLIFFAGLGQLSVLVASALVPAQLNWKREFSKLSRLHRQMYWVYGGYVVLSIISLGTVAIVQSEELASANPLAVAINLYAAVFWGVRLCLQAFLDVRDHLKTVWLRLGYHALTLLFIFFTTVFSYAAYQAMR